MTTKNYDFLKFIHKKGFSQIRLCRQCNGISEPKLSRIINGHATPSETELLQLSAALNSPAGILKRFFQVHGKV